MSAKISQKELKNISKDISLNSVAEKYIPIGRPRFLHYIQDTIEKHAPEGAHAYAAGNSSTSFCDETGEIRPIQFYRFRNV